MTNTTKTLMLSTVFTAVTTLASMSDAHAQAAAAPPAAQADPEDVVTGTPDAPAARATATDPNIDRGFLLPTAMTQPAGSVTYNNYELLLHGITYGITDRVQASVTVVSPIVEDMPFIGFAAVKGRIVSTDRFHLALQGSLGYVHVFDADSTIDGNGYTLGAGALASYCLREDCSSLLSASATYQLAMSGSGGSGGAVVYGGSIVHRVGSHVKLLGEVTSAAGSNNNNGMRSFENIGGALVGYGVRFHTNTIAADVGFVKPVGDDGFADDLLLGIPFGSVSYRWQ